MVGRIAQRVIHHHAVGHRGVNRAQPILAIQAFGDPFPAGLNGAFAGDFRPKPLDAFQPPIERFKPGLDHLADMGGLHGQRRGAARKQLVHQHTALVFRLRLERTEHQQRHHNRARPIAHLQQMHRKPARREDQFGRDRRHAIPWARSKQRQLNTREHIGPLGAARRQDRRAGAGHMGRRHIIADHLQREIGLDARRNVKAAAMIQRPAVMAVGLDAAQIAADPGLQHQIIRLAQKGAQQDIFRRNGRVRLQLIDPVAICALLTDQRGGGAGDAGLDHVAGGGAG